MTKKSEYEYSNRWQQGELTSDRELEIAPELLQENNHS